MYPNRISECTHYNVGIIRNGSARAHPVETQKLPVENMLENKKINLDMPVDAYDAQGNLKEKPEGVSEEVSTEGSQPEEKPLVELDKQDEQKVPYSRFDKVRREREEALEEAEEARKLLKQMREEREVSRETPSLSSYEEDYARKMKQLLGDNPVSKEIIDLNLKSQRDLARELEERAERRALEAVENQRTSESRAIIQNENIIDNRLEALSDRLGRRLTEQEEAAILDVVDEYTPVGEDGKYAGEILSFDKALEIVNMRQSQQSMSSKRARSAAVNAGSVRSQGEPTGVATEQQNKEWNPLNWKSLYDRVGK